ncbi:hypothetical protein C3369_16420 [Escherichia sp. ESNIH1]|uniref:hypothetical protein n=1 Tax=Escherichia sp. ESNIH1 TaxID=1985876 RepID=UPI000CDDEFC7|nr:hypothetical protein [Escherichia sp. ESNIH1]POT99530.1 hypothetical protein C3369_16420 [Escherichia sp. ESNIH1]
MIFKVTFQDIDRTEDIEAPEDVRAGDRINLIVDGVTALYTVLTVSGPIFNGECVPAMMRVTKD